MYKYCVSIPVLFFFLLAGAPAPAQTTSDQKAIDSSNAVLFAKYKKWMAAIEQQNIEDSIRKAALESQLGNAATGDLKKEVLQKQLQKINTNEAGRLAEKQARLHALRLSAKSFPVHGFFNDTLFLIYSKLGSFSAAERAAAIEKRIRNLKDSFGLKKDFIQLSENETAIDLITGETILISITGDDAAWNGASKAQLAKKYTTIITDAVTRYNAATSFTTILQQTGLALLVLAGIGIIMVFLSKFFKMTAAKIQVGEGKRLNGIKLRNYTLLDARRQINFLLSINTIAKWLLVLLLAYIALPVLFGIFPWTKNFAHTLFSYVLNPLKKIGNGFWNYLPNLFTIIVIVIVFHYVLKLIHFFKKEIEKGNLKLSGFYPDWANPSFQILRIILYAFMIVLIFPYLPGSDSPIFKGISVFLGVLFTFGSSGSLSNIVAGLVLTYMRLFKIGDRVKIGDVTGDIIEKSLLVTRIRTIKNEIISIPNSTVMSSHTINYSSDTEDKGLILHTTVTIGYDVPWKEIHQALLDAAGRTVLLLKDPAPYVLQTSLDDFYVAYQINAYTKEATKQAAIYSELHSNIQDCCNEAGIEILSPHYRAARDGNATTIPAQYLSKDYKIPGFNLNMQTEKQQ